VRALTFVDAKQRFSGRVGDYARHRPGYPLEVLDILRQECGLRADHVIADVGSGTGLLSELFLKNGNTVFGVEPNAEMRQAGEQYLQGYTGFTSVAGSAEATTLPRACSDFVSAGQAFHWFEPNAARAEFRRILRPGGWFVAVWNFRDKETKFGRAYESLLEKYGTDYTSVREAYPKGHDLDAFFQGGPYLHRTMPNLGLFDWDRLAGWLRSSSFVPREGHPNFEPMMAALRELFDALQRGAQVQVENTTHLYAGRIPEKRN